jgi:hypothetical protein
LGQEVPVFLVFLCGVGLRRSGLMKADDGGTLLRAVFCAGQPALIVQSFLAERLDWSYLALALFPPVVIGVTLAVVLLFRRSWLRELSARTFGALAGATILNTGFLFPFVQRVYGDPGVARLAVLDSVSGLLAFSLVYAVVVGAGSGSERPGTRFIARKLLTSPPLWAIAVSVLMKAAGLSLPGFLDGAISIAATLVSPAILLALGLLFTLRMDKPRLLVIPLVLRFGLGAMLAAVFVRVTGLSGLSAAMVYLVGIAPIGYSSVAFAEMERLDTGFAVSQVSLALLIAFAVMPLVVRLPAAGGPDRFAGSPATRRGRRARGPCGPRGNPTPRAARAPCG